MSDIVERLRYWGADDDGWLLIDEGAAEVCLQAADEIERLRAALKRISELDVPRTVRRTWRLDGVPSKHDQCPHDLRMYEDCYACIAEYAGAVLEGKETK